MIRLSLIVSLAVILIAGCSPERPGPQTTTQAILNIQIIDIIGPSIDSSRPLNRPRDIAVNMIGEIFIADYGNDRIVKLDSTHNYISEVGGFGSSSYALNGPVSISLDNVSNLYVIDSGNRRILRFDRNFNFISEEKTYTKSEEIDFINPTCIEATVRGEIFIGDEGLGSCFKLDQFFDYIYDFGSLSSNRPVAYPSDIEYDNNYKIYVADSEYGSIFIFDDFGLHIQTFGDNVLTEPSAVAVSLRTGIWVTDSQTGLLHCFDYRGNEIFRWNGQGHQQLEKPTGLFIDSDETIYIVDSATARIFITKPILRK